MLDSIFNSRNPNVFSRADGIVLILLFFMFVAYLIQLFRGRAIEEAEEYCLKFVDKNGFKAIGKKSVNFKGLDIEVVNDIVAELDRVFDGTDIKKFDSIEVFGKVNKKYWQMHPDAPMAVSNFGNLFLNKEKRRECKNYI